MLLENLDVFFSMDEFAVAAILTSQAGSAEVKVIFDKEYIGMSDFEAEGRRITALCKSADVVEVHHQDLIEIEGTTYAIAGIQPVDDGKITELVLKESDE